MKFNLVTYQKGNLIDTLSKIKILKSINRCIRQILGDCDYTKSGFFSMKLNQGIVYF